MSHTTRAFAPNQHKDTEFLNNTQAHGLARMAQMMAEERGEDLSYEDALNL